MAFVERPDRAMLGRYRALRDAGKTFATKITRAMPRSVVVSAARNLGLWKRGGLMAEEHEVDVLMDRAIYDEKWDGRGVLDRFLEMSPAVNLTKDERRYCEIMESSRFSLFGVVRVDEPEILTYLIKRDFGSRRRRIDQPDGYSIFFHELHRRIGIPVRYAELETGLE
jgi:hypothetical protein